MAVIVWPESITGATSEDARSLALALIPLSVAAIAAAVAVTVHWSTQRFAARDRKRGVCAKAMTDALAWTELPYRISRRIDDKPETVRSIVERSHDLQESMLFHLSWLQVEVPEACHEYAQLIRAAKAAVESQIKDAWDGPPCPHPRDSPAGAIAIDRSDVEAHLARFTELVHSRLR
jgi:hypothetical protein